mmetsp:Transcript_45171/g.130821  ORF Transcript_45171/g.130821 Transcript_45171/m.130821 type:complete len:1021 (-) Transcript_45171:88-3150(-)
MGRCARWSLAALAFYASGGFLAALWHQPYYAVVILLIIVFASLFFFGDSEYATRLALEPEDAKLLGVIINPLRWPSLGLRTARSLRSSHEADQYFVIAFSFLSVFLLVLPDMYSRMSEAQDVETVLVAWAPVMLLPAFAQLAWHSWFVRKKDRIKGIHYGPFRQSKLIQEQLDLVRKLMHGGVQRRTRLCQACCRLTSYTAARDRRLYDLFESMEGSVLNDVLMGLVHTDTPLQHILYVVKNREALVELLGVRRVHQLSVPAKSMMLNTFMFLRLQSCPALEQAVEALLLSTAGDDLSELKSRQDAGNSQSMHKLIFQDITDLEVRQRLLDHFLSEAQAQVAERALLRSPHFAELLRMGRARGCVPQHLRFVDQLTAKYQGGTRHAWMKVISDIDDTVECSGNKWPSGIDARYPRHTTYPGVTAFFRELQGGGEVGHLVLLSARPHICGSLMEQRIFKKFAKKGEDSFFCQPAVLPGDLVSGADFVLNGSMQALADRKFRNFEKYFRIYPEFRFVFLGDNGQADYEVGKRMCKEFGRHIEQVWIHRVRPEESTFGYSSDTNAEGPLNFFADYIDAAVHACSRQEPLISLEGLTRVVEGARTDFSRIRWNSDADRERERERLNGSIERANNLLTTLCCQSLPLIEDVDPRELQLNYSDQGSDCCSDADSHHPHPPHPGFFDSMWRKVSRTQPAADSEAPCVALAEGDEHGRAQAEIAPAEGVVDKPQPEPGQATPPASKQTDETQDVPELQNSATAAAAAPSVEVEPQWANDALAAAPASQASELHADSTSERRTSGSMLGGIWQSTRTILQRKAAEDALGSPPAQSPVLAPAVATEGAAHSHVQDTDGAHEVAELPDQVLPDEGTPSARSDAAGAESREASPTEGAGKLGLSPEADKPTEGCLAKTILPADPSVAANALGSSMLTEAALDLTADSGTDRKVSGSRFGGIWQSTRTILQRKGSEDSHPSPLVLPATAPSATEMSGIKEDMEDSGVLLTEADIPCPPSPQTSPKASCPQDSC